MSISDDATSDSGRPTRYEMTWRNKFLTMHAKSISEMADILQSAASDLREMASAGVVLAHDSAGDDYATLVTADPALAERFGFYPQEEDDEEDDQDAE